MADSKNGLQSGNFHLIAAAIEFWPQITNNINIHWYILTQKLQQLPQIVCMCIYVRVSVYLQHCQCNKARQISFQQITKVTNRKFITEIHTNYLEICKHSCIHECTYTVNIAGREISTITISCQLRISYSLRKFCHIIVLLSKHK